VVVVVPVQVLVLLSNVQLSGKPHLKKLVNYWWNHLENGHVHNMVHPCVSTLVDNKESPVDSMFTDCSSTFSYWNQSFYHILLNSKKQKLHPDNEGNRNRGGIKQCGMQICLLLSCTIERQ
jgi:hypothetical protein